MSTPAPTSASRTRLATNAPVIQPDVPDPIAVGGYALNIASPWNQSTATGFNARYGRYPAIIHQFVPVIDTTRAPMNEGTNRSLFDIGFANDAAANGAVPLFSTEMRDHTVPVGIAHPQPLYTLDRWISGANDTVVVNWLQAAGAWGGRAIWRFGWEMTGWDYSWSVNFPPNTPGKYRDFWQRMVGLQRRWAPNLEPVWCPSVLLPANAKLTPMSWCYPGDDWVTWVGLDGYITGNASASGPNRSFLELFAPSVMDVQSFTHNKKILICETGVNPTIAGSYSTDWLLGIPDAAAQMPAIAGICFFDNQQSVIHNEPQKTAITTIVANPYLQGALTTP